MKRNGKYSGRAMSITGGATFGAGCALLWTLAGSALLAWLIHTQKLAEERVGYGSMVILLSASVMGSLVSYGKTKRQRLVTCLSSAGIYLMMLLGMTAFFWGGQYTGIGVTALLVIAGSGASVLVSMERERRGVRKTRKIRI